MTLRDLALLAFCTGVKENGLARDVYIP